MNDATLIADLIRAGVDPDLVARVSNAMVAVATSTGIPPDSAAEKRRAYDRARKRNSTGIPPESTGIPKSASLNKKEEDLKKESKKERASRIAPEWTPSIADVEFALSKGMQRGRIDTEAEKFCNYWKAKSGAAAVKLDWPATWRNWVLSSLERTGGALAPVNTEPIWKRPPPEFLARQKENRNAESAGTQVRSDSRALPNGADHSGELPSPRGSPLRAAGGGTGPPAPDGQADVV